MFDERGEQRLVLPEQVQRSVEVFPHRATAKLHADTAHQLVLGRLWEGEYALLSIQHRARYGKVVRVNTARADRAVRSDQLQRSHERRCMADDFQASVNT